MATGKREKVSGTDTFVISRDNLTGRADLLRQPNGHRSPACPNFETAPARSDQVPPLARERIKHLLQQPQPLVLHIPASLRGESVPRIIVRIFAEMGVGGVDHLREEENSDAIGPV